MGKEDVGRNKKKQNSVSNVEPNSLSLSDISVVFLSLAHFTSPPPSFLIDAEVVRGGYVCPRKGGRSSGTFSYFQVSTQADNG